MKTVKAALVFFLFLISPFAVSKTADSRNFSVNSDNAFMMSLNAVSKLNFEVVEMQAASGYILFKTPSGDEYLIMITEDGEISNIKITKLKNSSPLLEIQEIVFNAISKELDNPLKRAD